MSKKRAARSNRRKSQPIHSAACSPPKLDSEAAGFVDPSLLADPVPLLELDPLLTRDPLFAPDPLLVVER